MPKVVQTSGLDGARVVCMMTGTWSPGSSQNGHNKLEVLDVERAYWRSGRPGLSL